MDQQTQNSLKAVNSYDSVARKYHESLDNSKNFFNMFVEEPGTLKKFDEMDLNKKKILDLGCGSGRYTKELKKRGAEVIGVDPSEELLKIAREEGDGIEYIKADADKLPFGDNQFDVVFAGMVMHYFKNVSASFREISRVLRPGGIFIFTSHVPYLGITKRYKFDGKQYYDFDNYFSEGERHKVWGSLGVKMVYQHHTMESIMKAAIQNLFMLSDYIDLKPNKEGKNVDLGDYDEAVNKSKFFLAEFIKK